MIFEQDKLSLIKGINLFLDDLTIRQLNSIYDKSQMMNYRNEKRLKKL